MPAGPNERLTFVVDRPDWTRGHVESSALPDLGSDQVLLRVDRFAFTANNVTYAAMGEMLDYWGFFPRPEGSGCIPAMGYADVAASRHPQVAEGTRVFGFFPMSSHLVVDAAEAGPAGFVDGVAHRKGHAQAYRQYSDVKADPAYDAAFEDETILLRGLFLTSFLVDAFMADQALGARHYVVGSASSKTGIALAFLLARQGRGRVYGITSPRNRDFVAGLGCYDETLAYDEVESLPADVPTAFVDQSGDAAFVARLHRHLRDRLVYSGIVGATHWDAGGERPQDLPGPEPAFFFAPTEIARRVKAWGPQGFQQRLGEGWRAFRDASRDWLRVERGHGPDAVERVFARVVGGRAHPSEGHVLSLWESP